MKSLVETMRKNKLKNFLTSLSCVLLYSAQHIRHASAQSDEPQTFRITDHLGEFLTGVLAILAIIFIRQIIVKRKARNGKKKTLSK